MAALIFLLASTALALPAVSNTQPPIIPITFRYGNYPRIEADIAWGTPAQQFVPTIFDTGSSAFWVYGPNATINDGSQYHYTQGPCNKSVKNFYNYPASKTHSKPVIIAGGKSYSYGGNGKIVSGYNFINDSFSFANTKWPALQNNQVALANFTVVSQLDDNCAIAESSFDHSILGLAPSTSNLGEPSFRQNLLSQRKTTSSSFSMWMDKPPQSAKGQYQGTAVFGAVPGKSKYSGELVRLKQTPPSAQSIGYYVAIPKLATTSISKPGKAKNIPLSHKDVTTCLLDSGTGQDRLPFSQDEVLKTTGLFQYEGQAEFVAWNGSCDSIPLAATLNYTFAGATSGKSVTVAVPIRSYARGEYDEIEGVDSSKVCGLSLSLDEAGDCVFGAPFFASAFAVFYDEKKQVALAQGGVSTGAVDGPSGLGPLSTIVAGQDIPGSC